jgi:regulator of protease activity HflC (stomatin/prohibitin superfamily)
MNNSNINLTPYLIKKAIWGIVAIVVFTIGMAFIRPWYNVWSQEMEGKAEFAKAEQNRKIKIEEARANLEAEKLNAQAEIERAKGAAEAIKIENGSITPTYIQYLWVRQQSDLSDKTVIYIPTESNLPLLESTRMNKIGDTSKQTETSHN